MTTSATDRLLGWSDVNLATGLSRTTVHRLRAAGTFPEPVIVSPGRVAWQSRKVTAWMNSRPTRADLAAARPKFSRSRKNRAPTSPSPEASRAQAEETAAQLVLFE